MQGNQPLSTGKDGNQAGKLCGRSRVDFLNALPGVSVAISNLTPEDLEDDIAYAKHG